MFVKYFLFVLVSIALAQGAAPSRKKRDVPSAEEAGKAIGDLIDDFRTNAGNLLKNIKNSDVYKDFSEALNKFGNAVQNEASKLADKVKNN
ncbi:hypothetical protein FQR65_LT11054 [Abscondita terminalis]|nr:hypothetical protein FQR65_LT11054 [Abscondita terminalis]